jgi:hypothetical protein
MFECTFPLEYHTDPTDTNAEYDAQNWLASVQIDDDDGLDTTLVEADSGNAVEVVQFLAYNVPSATVDYDDLSINENSIDDGVGWISTDMQATGNVGLDQQLAGSKMCKDYNATTNPDCTTPLTTDNVDNILPNNHKVTEDNLDTWAAGTSLDANPSNTINFTDIDIPKTIYTGSVTVGSDLSYWALGVPGTLTTSGLYLGQNELYGITSPSTEW